MEDTLQRLSHIPARLREISDPPEELYIRGTLPSEKIVWICVVGSRKYTPYGKNVCQNVIRELAGYPIVIVSGLALGIDAIAHQTALEVGLTTVAVPGSGLANEVLYPRTHLPLAQTILTHGGALISEFKPTHKARPEDFPKRNRIMAGLCHAVLIIEAEERSGTLITARLALDYNRDVLAIPGPLHSSTSAGPHYLIRSGATLIRGGEDVLDTFNLKSHPKDLESHHLTDKERFVLDLLHAPLSRDELLEKIGGPISQGNVLIGSLELRGFITEELGVIRRK